MSPVQQALRSQRLTVLYAVIVCLAFLVGAQWVLLAITIEGFQGGQRDLLIPSAAASGLCCAAALALMWSATSARTEN